MSAHVDVVEVGPRDGLQSEPQAVPTATKIAFVQRALAAGIRRVEVTSFVNPKKVPQMADAEEVLRALGAPPAGVHYIGLVLNRRGFERAVAAGCNEVGMAVVASDTFNRRNQGVSTEESIATWLDIAREAERAGVRAQVTVSAAFGCPFEGEIAVDRVVEVVQRVAAARPFEIALADTIGVGVPTQVGELVARVREAVPGIALRCHFHNTRNTGFANVYAALQAGVRTFDASLGGIGIMAIYFQKRRGWRAGTVQMAVDAFILLGAFWVVAPLQVALSLLGAAALNMVIAVNHRSGRYFGV